MNLWRVAIDERSGRVLDAPEPVATPSMYAGHISFARDGTKMAYANFIVRANLQAIGFDPDTRTIVGEPRWLTRGSMTMESPDISPDGQWLVFTASSATEQEDIYVMRRDGTERRKLTDDVAKDRTPRWSPDGRQLAFYSDRSGRYEIWLINRDGSGLRRLTHSSGSIVYYPVWAPDGRRLLYQHMDRGNFIIDLEHPERPPQRLPQDGIEKFTPWAWSPDGDKLIGGVRIKGQTVRYLNVYSFTTQTYEPMTSLGLERTAWLRDNRQVIFRTEDHELYLLDTHTRETSKLLSAAPDAIKSFALSPDNREVVFSRWSTEVNIWLATSASEADRDPSGRSR
ncbi:MAG: hypothetical protein AAGC55_12690, partial [Myxococcota bacterium]